MAKNTVFISCSAVWTLGGTDLFISYGGWLGGVVVRASDLR